MVWANDDRSLCGRCKEIDSIGVTSGNADEDGAEKHHEMVRSSRSHTCCSSLEVGHHVECMLAFHFADDGPN